MTPRKLRILLLHGHAQTAEDMAKKSGALRSEVKKVAEFIPFESPVRTEDGRVTWYAFDRQPSGETRYTGVEEAVALLSRFAQEEGPFDGVWGFSMGALMAAYVCSLMSAGGVPPELRFKFGIFFASPSPGDPAFPLGTDIEMPSFHCWGESDELIPAARSKQVSESFIQPVTVTHAGGHLMPSAAPVRKSLKAFLVEQRSRITELEAAAAAAASPAEDGELGAQQ